LIGEVERIKRIKRDNKVIVVIFVREDMDLRWGVRVVG